LPKDDDAVDGELDARAALDVDGAAAADEVWPDDADVVDDAAFDAVAVDEVAVDDVAVDEADAGEVDDEDTGEDEAEDEGEEEVAAKEEAVVLLLLLAVLLALFVAALDCEDVPADELLAGVEIFGVLALVVLTTEAAALCSFVIVAIFADELDNDELPIGKDSLSSPDPFSITSTQRWSSRYGLERSPSL
jgi:hypothetical protein